MDIAESLHSKTPKFSFKDIGVKIHLQSRALQGDKELASECVYAMYIQSILLKSDMRSM
jgi:hypothetical protein